MTTEASEKPVVGYCRSCGKSLTEDTVCQSLGTLYCAEHVPAAAPPPPPDPYPSPYAIPPNAHIPPEQDVNPGLAFILGIIPGVGAIYNGQYGKGLIHVVIFGLLVSLANSGDQFEFMFGWLAAAFGFYMAFEAYHTAKKRRAGMKVDEFSSLVGVQGSHGFPAGPVLLIAIGVLFLLNNLELVSIRQLVRWWPLGLIALGVYLLYIRVAGTGDGSASASSEGSRVQQ